MEDDDRTLPEREIQELCRRCDIVLQEKLDGTNVGLFFDREGVPICQKRAGLLETREKDQYNAFRNWAYERAELLWQTLCDRWALFGEWLWQTHALPYDRLPDYFVAFDLLDRKTGRFAASTRLTAQVEGRLALVPTLWQGSVCAARDLLHIAAAHLGRSAFSDSPAEGVYVRFEMAGELRARAKYRRPGFVPGWKEKPARNQLRPTERPGASE